MDRGYRTQNGFYLGDLVELPDGREGHIDEIVTQQVHVWYNKSVDIYQFATVVRLDDELWLDISLTRL